MNKYVRVRELIFRLFRDVSLGRLCSNSLIASVTTASRNLTPAPRGCKTACKCVLFFDHGQAGYLTYLGSLFPCKKGPQLTIGSCVSVRSQRYEARGKFGEHERCVREDARVALGYAASNSFASFVLSKLPACFISR